MRKMTKEFTAYVFPNAIRIEHTDGTEVFLSAFYSRDSAYNVLYELWQLTRKSTQHDASGHGETDLSSAADEIEWHITHSAGIAKGSARERVSKISTGKKA